MNPRFTFTCEYRDKKGELERKTEVITTEIAIPEILEAVEDFLRGCGFFFDGNIEVVRNVHIGVSNDSERSNSEGNAESEV